MKKCLGNYFPGARASGSKVRILCSPCKLFDILLVPKNKPKPDVCPEAGIVAADPPKARPPQRCFPYVQTYWNDRPDR